MKDDPNRPRERERLAAQMTIDQAEAQIAGLEARLEKLDADREATQAEVDRLYGLIEGARSEVEAIEDEYGQSDPEVGDGQVIGEADVADAAWLAGEEN